MYDYYKKDELVATITTDELGFARSDDLPLGKYYVVEKELEIAKDKARQEGKKEEMLDKIAQGRLNKFYQEVCLLEQAFVKDPKQTIQQYLHSSNKELTAVACKRITLNEE